MKLSTRFVSRNSARFVELKSPELDDPEAQRDPAVAATVSTMLREIAAGGLDAVRRFAARLDGDDSGDFEIDAAALARAGESLNPELRAAIELGSQRTQQFARLQREHLSDFEAELSPGLVTGQRYIPVGSVGAYLPAGRFPLTASAFMSVGVAKVAIKTPVISAIAPSTTRIHFLTIKFTVQFCFCLACGVILNKNRYDFLSFISTDCC